MNGPPEPNKWRTLDLDSEYTAGMAWTRLQWLFKYDPYVSMLSEWTYRSLCGLIFSDECLGSSNIVTHERTVAERLVMMTLNKSAIAMLFTDQFKVHIVDMTMLSVYSGDPDHEYSPKEK